MELTIDEIILQIEEWLEVLVSYFPRIIWALVAMLIASFMARFVGRRLSSFGRKHIDNKMLGRLLSTISSLLIILVGLIIALRILRLDGVVTSVLAGAGIIGFALGFAFQDIASNFISGIIIATQKPFRVGDLVETNDHYGTVRTIHLRMTEIQTLTGQIVYIPNKEILLQTLVDYSTLQKRRVDIHVGVSYGDKLEKVEKVTLEAIDNLEQIDDGSPVDLYYQEFGDSSINFVVRFWINFQRETDFLQAQSEAIKAIKAAYDKNNITIPFPIRTLDFGIKGGSTLSEQKVTLAKKK